MAAFTRRTHIVRISDAAQGQPPSDSFIDVEVLDAIAFRIKNGEEVILNMDPSNSDPWIVDDTGGNHGTQPDSPTQRTHMHRVIGKVDPLQRLDIEVMDCFAFRDQNGEAWILDMQNGSGDSASVFDITDGAGDQSATRRTHKEIIADPFGTAKKDTTSYLTVQRNDSIAFRKVRGEEVILSCPSNDDPNSGTDFNRASTFIVTPQDYDPSNPNSPIPPTLEESGDKHVYVAFVDGASGFLTDDAEIAQGPFWWIRNVSAGGAYILVTLQAVNKNLSSPVPPPLPEVHVNTGDPKKPHATLLDQTSTSQTSSNNPTDTKYFVWSDILPFPTKDNYHNPVGNAFASYASQFMTGPVSPGTTFTPPFDTGIPIGPGTLEQKCAPGTAVFIDFHDGRGPVPAGCSFPQTTLDPPDFGGPFNGIPDSRNFYFGSSGYFDTLAQAQAAASAWEAFWTHYKEILSFPDTLGAIKMHNADNSAAISFGFPPRVYGASLPLTEKANATTSITYQYLFKVPGGKQDSLKIDVKTSGDVGLSGIFVTGYTDAKKKVKTLADIQISDGVGGFINPNGVPADTNQAKDPAKVDVRGDNAAVSTTYTVQTQLVAGNDPATKPHHLWIKTSNA